MILTTWHKAALFDANRAQVSAWIYQIARNRQIDAIRKERRLVPEDIPPEAEAGLFCRSGIQARSAASWEKSCG